jgi:membrane protease YdiL (CAAX protease family)
VAHSRLALETLGVFIVCSAVTFALRCGLGLAFDAPSAAALVDPRLAPDLTLADSPWTDCLAMVVAFVGLPLVWEVGVRKVRLREIGFGLGEDRLLSVYGGLAAGLVLWALVPAAGLLLHRRPPTLYGPHNTALLVSVLCLAAVSEEVFFRGVLQRRLTEAVGAPVAVLAVSLVFAFAGHPSADPLISLVVRLPASLAIGWLYWRTGSLLPACLAHGLFDLLIAAG